MPEITTDDGPLTAAIDTPSVNNGVTSASDACDRHHRPTHRQRLHQPAPRRHQHVHASSNESTPATCAAATSPIE
jgi:hypothetical protein